MTGSAVRELQSTLSPTTTRGRSRYSLYPVSSSDNASTFSFFQDIEKFYNTQIDEMPMNVADLI